MIAAGQAFQAALTRCEIRFPLSHASYLINLASPDVANRAKGVQTLLDELDRAALLGIPNVVLHPGAYTSGSATTGIRTVIGTLDQIFRDSPHTPTRILLENTAGQGTTLGATLNELSQIQRAVQYPKRIGICIDTCHAFAAGYDLASASGYQKFWDEVDQTVGIGQVLAIHLNDSKKECGSRVDRHEHIGKGCIGLEGFRRLLNDSAVNSIPMYLETDKGEDDNGEDWDVVNLRTLRSLVD
jgi:deoxyribonuclease-4